MGFSIRFRNTRNWIWLFGQTKFEFFACAEVSFILSIPVVDSFDCGLVLSGCWLLAITGIDILAEMLLCDVMFRDFNSGGFFIDDENARPRRKVALFMKEREREQNQNGTEKRQKMYQTKVEIEIETVQLFPQSNQSSKPDIDITTNMYQNQQTNEMKYTKGRKQRRKSTLEWNQYKKKKQNTIKNALVIYAKSHI